MELTPGIKKLMAAQQAAQETKTVVVTTPADIPTMKPSTSEPDASSPNDAPRWAGDRDPFAPALLQPSRERWDAFDWDRHPALRASKRTIVDWFNSLVKGRDAPGVLLLAGHCGAGKTHIAESLGDAFGRWRVSFVEELEFVKRVQATYDKGSAETEERILRQVFDCDLLIYDDLGAYGTPNEEWMTNIYRRIFNDWIERRNKPLIITTNMDLEPNLRERIGQRNYSRLHLALGDDLHRYVDLFAVRDARLGV